MITGKEMDAASRSTAAHSLGAFAAYILIEILLPKGALVALLFWMLRSYFRDGFASVRQYLHAPHILKPAIFSNPQPGMKKLCRCLRQIVSLNAWPGGFHQRCEPLPGASCCAT